ncbi:F-box protein [Hibiscus syriacus]|uniref:F-box protein n=1 Tax=Hibiscus syriacus TaxID=106335 RepID=A0A6A2ZSZ5_HIBSY|nr:F-box protein At5g39250-like [Hibiscus syriacus]KAE8694389.1 F-box protein [Hibiscus syriacus]
MSFEEVLKVVFPFLDGIDLAACMLVCKQWRHIAKDDYFWKCVCARRCPSTCKRPDPPTATYCKLYQLFYKQQHRRTLPPPRLSFDELEFFIDIWTEDKFIFSEVVPGSVLQRGMQIPSAGICDMLKFHLEGPEYKLTLPVDPSFTIPVRQNASVLVLVGRKDSKKAASIINKSPFLTASRALAFDYLVFSPNYPFISTIRAWVSLLFAEDGAVDVFGIEMDFSEAANSKEEVLWLLDMLDWK